MYKCIYVKYMSVYHMLDGFVFFGVSVDWNIYFVVPNFNS